MQSASVGCQRDKKMRSRLLLQQCELHLFASLHCHQMWPWVRSKVKARLLHHIDETWLIPFYNCTCIIPWLGFQSKGVESLQLSTLLQRIFTSEGTGEISTWATLHLIWEHHLWSLPCQTEYIWWFTDNTNAQTARDCNKTQACAL